MLSESHLHFHGCVRPADHLRRLAAGDRVLWDWYETEMAAAYGAVPPTREVVERYRRGDAGAEADFEKLFVFGDDDAGTFARFQAKANLLWVTPTDVTDLAAGIRADQARQGLAYAELRISADMLPALSGGSGTSVIERFAITLDRQDPWTGWEHVRELALGPHGHALTGIDFCGVEEGRPPKDKAAFFSAVRDFNAVHPERALAILYHVGESFTDKSLESAVRWVQEAAEAGAHRLGHAIALGVDPRLFGTHTREESVAERRDQIAYDLRHGEALRAHGVPVDPPALRAELARLAALPATATVTVAYDTARLEEVGRRQEFAMGRVRASGAVIEVCPTSNRRIAGITDPARHPVHRFLAAGLPFVVSTDDPGLFGITLDDELDWVCAHTGGGPDLRHRLVRAGWEYRSEALTGRAGATARGRHG
ncbi:amidohydrolase family protein [Streptomyces specialis]|uniref:hypothetical protein n=1 Tax=Streptomyces specialis TaxID=498367 RepID=UPI00073E7C4F|nr:hypothetical protein [Streptomyces specialis]